MDMFERMSAGLEYVADDPRIAAANTWAIALADRYNATAPDASDLRHELLVELLGSIGSDCELRPPVRVDYGRNIFVGDRVFANYGLVALDVARIVIGSDVQIGPQVQLLTPTHPVAPERRRAKWESAQPITIGANVWLGGGVIVCPGVTIGADTVVGAGSVVTRDLPERVVAVGNPARVVRRIDDEPSESPQRPRPRSE